MTDKRSVGRKSEEVAAKLLHLNGYEVIAKNYRVKSGEIDIIAKDGDYLCFIEVKARKTKGSGFPEEAVGLQKQQKIRHTALFFLYENQLPETTPVRFDVCVILGNKYKIIKNAFDFG